MSERPSWLRLRDLSEALAMLADEPSLTPIAGGTDLMVGWTSGSRHGTRFLDLTALGELRGVDLTAGETRLGALTTYSQVLGHHGLAARHPLLAAAAGVSGGWAIRNRGTLGGNLVNASPAADSPPALLAGEARVELASHRGSRWVDVAHFYTGYRRTLRAADEIVTRIALPAPKRGGVSFYRKVGGRRGPAIAKISLAARAEIDGGHLTAVRIALGAVAPIPIRARSVEAMLEGADPGSLDRASACDLLLEEIAPIDDLRSTAAYRRRVAAALLDQFLEYCREVAEGRPPLS